MKISMFYALERVKIFSYIQIYENMLWRLLKNFDIPSNIEIIAFEFNLTGKEKWLFMCIYGRPSRVEQLLGGGLSGVVDHFSGIFVWIFWYVWLGVWPALGGDFIIILFVLYFCGSWVFSCVGAKSRLAANTGFATCAILQLRQ